MRGIGSMLHELSGGSKHNPDEFYGREISEAKLEENTLKLKFSDGIIIEIRDNGQSCCENRYMSCDDDLETLIGHKLLRIEAKDGPSVNGEYDEYHEQVFVEIGTDAGFVTLVNHNEHNGYYGGFGLTITTSQDEKR